MSQKLNQEKQQQQQQQLQQHQQSLRVISLHCKDIFNFFLIPEQIV